MCIRMQLQYDANVRGGTQALLLSDKTLSDNGLKINQYSFTPIVTITEWLQLLNEKTEKGKSKRTKYKRNGPSANCQQLRILCLKLQFWFLCTPWCLTAPPKKGLEPMKWLRAINALNILAYKKAHSLTISTTCICIQKLLLYELWDYSANAWKNPRLYINYSSCTNKILCMA